MKNKLTYLFFLIFFGISSQSYSVPVYPSTQIWNLAIHNAFPDIIYFKNKIFITFREGSIHPGGGIPDGKVRIISSTNNGTNWISEILISDSLSGDIRGTKFIKINEDTLQIITYAVYSVGADSINGANITYFTTEGTNWSRRKQVGENFFWMYFPAYNNNKIYSIGYPLFTNSSLRYTRLYSTTDFDYDNYNVLKDTLSSTADKDSEAKILFINNNYALCVIRRDSPNALIGRAFSPFTNWTFTDCGYRIGGPNIIKLSNGKIIVAGRLQNPTRTSLLSLDTTTFTVNEIISLESSGDTGYPGLLEHNDSLFITYYSSHSSNARIYLSKVSLTDSNLVLPVKLISFTSAVNRNNVELSWQTSEEINNNGFEIQRMENNIWTKLSFVSGKNTSGINYYSYIDKNVNPGIYKYRLIQKDFNGNFEIYNLNNEVLVHPPENFYVYNAYPNPFNSTFKINFDTDKIYDYQLLLYQLDGKLVKKIQENNVQPGYHSFNYTLDNFASGIYFMMLKFNDGKTEKRSTQKIILLK
ncbi:MAG TPA: T9SS type A sorting domain-containing protein [Ignavibacteria bacterium]|nr:T9SS type A sorting domain-containing protein [Ignavibacteria bacterium]